MFVAKAVLPIEGLPAKITNRIYEALQVFHLVLLNLLELQLFLDRFASPELPSV